MRVVALIEAGYRVMVLDNLSNSHRAVLDRLERICGTRPDFVEGDTYCAERMPWPHVESIAIANDLAIICLKK